MKIFCALPWRASGMGCMFGCAYCLDHGCYGASAIWAYTALITLIEHSEAQK